MFDLLKRVYALGFMKPEIVENQVKKGTITADQYKEITGLSYEQEKTPTK